jgi:hypothetical protein
MRRFDRSPPIPREQAQVNRRVLIPHLGSYLVPILYEPLI